MAAVSGIQPWQSDRLESASIQRRQRPRGDFATYGEQTAQRRRKKILADVGDLVRAVAKNADMDLDDCCRSVYEVAKRAAAKYGVIAEAAPERTIEPSNPGPGSTLRACAIRPATTALAQTPNPRYNRSRQLLILADTGGSNSCRTSAWKTELQSQLCNRFGLTVTVAHYPTGASKWNPIEHRLFSEISKNWAAEPLDSN